jgi:hypothetical protein
VYILNNYRTTITTPTKTRFYSSWEKIDDISYLLKNSIVLLYGHSIYPGGRSSGYKSYYCILVLIALIVLLGENIRTCSRLMVSVETWHSGERTCILVSYSH